MIRLLVLYGHPQDPAAFDRYYEQIHVPLAKRMQGLKKWTIGKATGTPGGGPSPYYYVADLYAESREALEAILATPEGQAAVNDVPNYANGGVTFIYTDVEDVI
ncbi:MAG: EthD family reductase [Pirellulales bacterium]